MNLCSGPKRKVAQRDLISQQGFKKKPRKDEKRRKAMRYLKLFAFFTLAAGAALAGDPYWQGRGLRHDYRDVGHDYAQADSLTAAISPDRWQLNEGHRC